MKPEIRNIWIGISCVFALLLYSCAKDRALSKEQLIKYVTDPENGLTKKAEMNGYKIQLTYRPVDLLIAPEVNSTAGITAEKIAELRNNYKNYIYFILSVSCKDQEIINKDLGDQSAFIDKIKQLSFGMKELAMLTTSRGDTVPVADFIYPRMYGSTGATSLMFVFHNEKIKYAEYVDFQLKDTDFSARQKFRFLVKDINNVPALSFTLKN